jgi:uncharacterized lipoprotein YmbA
VKARRLRTAAFAAALATGCLGGPTPAPEYFTLSAAAAPDAAPLAARPQLGLVLAAVERPRHLDRPELVTRDGPPRLKLWSHARWGGSLRSDVQRVVADDLARLLGTARIAVYPDEARFPVDCRVLLSLLELGGARGEPVLLRARWTLAGADGRALDVGETRLVQPVASPSFADYVAAQRAALAGLAREIAEPIARLP